MKIEVGKKYINKTHMYLRPAIKSFGNSFISQYNEVQTLAVGIHDASVGEFRNKFLYIMLNRSHNSEHCANFIQWLNISENYFVKDYLVDEYHKHMIVLKFPERFINAYDKFLLGKYSEMYTKEDLKYLNFENFEDKTPFNVLTKNRQYNDTYTKILNAEFNSTLLKEEVLDLEYDLPWSLYPEKEIFNYKIQ
jgi:hypothetical protein